MVTKRSHILKVGLSPSNKIIFICFNESPLKMMRNTFYFIVKTLFVLKITEFLSWLFGHVEKNVLIRKIRLISKFITSQPDEQRITTHILPNISRSKRSQTLKFRQVKKHKSNSFLQKSCRKRGRETSSIPLFVFLKSFIWGKCKCSAA